MKIKDEKAFTKELCNLIVCNLFGFKALISESTFYKDGFQYGYRTALYNTIDLFNRGNKQQYVIEVGANELTLYKPNNVEKRFDYVDALVYDLYENKKEFVFMFGAFLILNCV